MYHLQLVISLGTFFKAYAIKIVKSFFQCGHENVHLVCLISGAIPKHRKLFFF